MNKVIFTERIPIKLWLDDIDEKTLSQAKNLANLPFTFKHIAIMADAHVGYGMPIGGVMATYNMVVPHAVGSDIGCGMCAVKTSLTEISREILKRILGEIRKVVPLGFKKHKEKQDRNLMPVMKDQNEKLPQIISQEYNNALKSIGTLGGGNHFIEILKGDDGFIWIMIHSGSRNLGYKVADYYNKLAIVLNEKLPNPIPKEWQLASLPVDSEEGQAYLKEMQFCIDFALANRRLMMDRTKEVFMDIFKENIDFNEMINIAHNYASFENHFGKDVWLHRKGATKATKELIGIIPGSQGTKSYIVKGLGNPESFNSCAHGAGRKMGRKQACRELDFAEEVKKLEDQGILHSIRGPKDLEEAVGAYKSIDVVMENQKDLVDIEVELTPLAVVQK